MSGFISTRASSSRQAKKNAIQAMGAMDADVAEMAPREGSDVEMMSDGDGTDNDSSGLDDGSDDEYIEEAAGKRSAPAASAADEGPEEDLTEDALFHRFAGYVSRVLPGDKGIGGTSFQEDLLAIDDEELPQQSRPRRRAQRVHRPTYEVQQLLGRANMAFITQDHEEATKLFLEVIRHDPQVQAAWTTLASVYEEQGEKEMSLQMRFCGAHIEEDADTWIDLAEKFLSDGVTTQAIYCYRRAIKLDGTSSELIWKLVDVYRQTEQHSKAVDALRKIHRVEPSFLRDFNMLMEVHPIIMQTKQYAFGATAFGEAFTYHFATFEKPEDQEEENTMTIEHIVIYVDYLLKSGDPESAVGVIHRGQRWLQGRKNEKGWDAMDDDSEYQPKDADEEDETSGGYDLDNQLRYRLAVARLRLGQDDEALTHVNVILQLDAMIHGEMFKELGEALMKRQLWELALECWAVLHDRNMEDEPEVIHKLGVCQHHLKRHLEALESLRWVVEVEPFNTTARLELAAVLEDMGKKTEALEIVSEVIRTTDSRTGLSKGDRVAAQRLNKRVLEAQASTTMKGLWKDVQEAEEGINDGEAWALDKFIHSAGTMIETYRLAKSNFTKNRGITRIPKKRKYGSKNDFTSEAMAMQDRLERTLGFEDETPLDGSGKLDYEVVRQTEFYGIETEDWLALVIKYCCVLMVKNEDDVALDILEHVVWSGLFNSRRCEIALRLTIIACAMRIQSYERISDNAKRLAQMHQFRSEPLLLMLAALGGGTRQQNVWSHLALQKFLHREVRIFDEAVYGVKLRFNKRHQRWAQILTTGQSRRLGDVLLEDDHPDNPSRRQRGGEDGEEDDDDNEGADENEGEEDERADGETGENGEAEEHECPKPTRHSPVFNTLYGQNMLTTKSYQSALFYFFRAYEVNEYDPFLCFLIAQAYLGRALNRQSDNRNYQIAQGLAFLTRYRKLSPQDAASQEEVEYNFGRAFHHLGVTHLAVTHYTRVLDSVRARMFEVDDEDEREIIRQTSLCWEAAHNLMLIYAASGSLGLVRTISDEWLALVD